MNKETTEFTVRFGMIGRTIEYCDQRGTIIFTFDIGSSPRSVVLEHHLVRNPRPNNYDDAFVRSKQFLQSRGYIVEESGTAHPPPPLKEDDVTAILARELGGPLPPGVSVMPRPISTSFDDDGGSPWRLWVAGTQESGQYAGYKIVLDEYTRQFGIVNSKDIFAGFYGSFHQTAESLSLS